jgi:prophage DNA circulation protein
MSLESLNTASFRGVEFLTGDSTTEGGRKSITHEYPNSDRRFVEDMGLLQDVFSLTGIVSTQFGFEDRDNLKLALREEGPGELVHPYYGIVTVSAKPFTVTETLRELNVARFTMTFEQTDDSVSPTETSVKTSLIQSQASEVIASVADDITEDFSVLASLKSNYAAALAKLQEIGDTFTAIGKAVSAVTSFISTFAATVTSFVNGIVANILAPAQLADSITDMFLQFDTLAPDALAQFELAKQLFGFGSDDPIIEPTTVAQEQKADNQNLLNSAIRGNALAQAYNSAGNIDYGNELEVEEIRQALEEEYQDLVADTVLSENTLAVLQELRNTSRQFFDEISINVAKISTIDVSPIPMSILSYQYYASTDNTEKLIELNDTRDVSIVSGSVNILTP